MIRAANRFRSSGRIHSVRSALSVETPLLERTDECASTNTTLRALPRVAVVMDLSTLAQQHRWTKQRYFSTEKDLSGPSVHSSVDETLDKLFQDSQQQLAEASGTAGDALAAAQVAWEPTWYNVADQCVVAINSFHDITGLQYGWSIVGVTVILRLGLFPIMVQTQQTTSRMAHVQPELQLIKQRYEAIGTPSRQDQLQFSKQMKALFEKYKVKPMRAFTAPLIQLPLFMGMFFGLKKMPILFSAELATGGMFWFPDLTVPDPMYILPFCSAASFLLLIEMGKEQMMAQNAAQGALMVNVFRVLSLAMIPVAISFESSMLCYWTANNVLTIAQTGLLKTDAVRKYFGIWDPPKPVPGLETESLTQVANKIYKQINGEAKNEKEKTQRHNQAIDSKKRATQISREARSRRSGITGTRNS